MSTPATFGQASQVLRFMKEQNPTNRQMQNWLGAGDLQKMMLEADLSKVDRQAFKALLMQHKPEPIGWTPTTMYMSKVREWNNQFQLGLSEPFLDSLDEMFLDDEVCHNGSLQPTSILISFGKGLRYDYDVVMRIMEHELAKIGVVFTDFLSKAEYTISYRPGSEISETDRPSFGIAPLDIGRYWTRDWRVVATGEHNQRMPALEVAWLLALNPQVFAAMDGRTIPYMWAYGLTAGWYRVACFRHAKGKAFVGGDWDFSAEPSHTIVAFRES